MSLASSSESLTNVLADMSIRNKCNDSKSGLLGINTGFLYNICSISCLLQTSHVVVLVSKNVLKMEDATSVVQDASSTQVHGALSSYSRALS